MKENTESQEKIIHFKNGCLVFAQGKWYTVIFLESMGDEVQVYSKEEWQRLVSNQW